MTGVAIRAAARVAAVGTGVVCACLLRVELACVLWRGVSLGGGRFGGRLRRSALIFVPRLGAPVAWGNWHWRASWIAIG